MFKSNDRVGKIELLEQQIRGIKTPPNNAGYWQKLTDHCAKMSADQLNYVFNENEAVLNTKSRLEKAFNLFLFEKYKNEFVEFEQFRPLCDNYLDAVEDATLEYSNNITKTINENKKLRAKIQKLEKELNNAQPDTKGT